jgi:hypothetical protein
MSAGDTITIDINDGAMFLSIQNEATLGASTVKGNIPYKNLQPASVSLSAGQGVNISALSPQSPLDGLTISCTSGTTDVLIGF